jgi:uncharacterized LabA/DUF88 family protein
VKRILLIDNGYLDKNMSIRLDYRKVADHFGCEQAIVYDCVDHDSPRAKFIEALKHLPGFSVKLGRLQFTSNDTTVRVQKMVDVMLALDIVKSSQRFDGVVVLTGDMDFVPAFLEAQHNMCEVTLVHITRVDYELTEASNRIVLFDTKLQDKCRMERVV